MKRFLFSLLALLGAVAHADTIPDWLRHPASACSSTQVVRYLTPGARATCGAVAFSDLGSTPTTLAGYGITDAQARVSGTCATGNAIRAIAADGTVTCQSASGGGGGAWGTITGTLSDQLDLQAALDGKQPLDSDLTAIAALTTTSYGRGFLPLADAAAGRTYLGLGSLATQSGTFSGTSSGTNTGDQVVPATTTSTAHQFFSAYDATTGTFTKAQPDNVTGNAATATALAANPADCSANQYATTIAANGDLTCAQVAYAQVTGTPSLATVATTGAYSDLTGSPTLPANTTATAHQFFDAYNSTTGAFTKAQPACGDLSDAGTGCTATIANYVPTSTTVNGHALSSNVTVTASDVSLGSVTNDAQTKAAIVPNTAPSAGQILVGNAGGTAYAPVTLSGSGATATMSSAGVITLSAIPNATLSNSSVTVAGHSISLGGSSAIACADLSNGATGCSTATGTSGATIPLLNGANTWSGVQSINNGDLALKGATSGTITLNAAATAGTSTITLPGGTTDFSSTGGTSQVVKQTSSGGPFTVGQLACSDLSNAATSCSTDATNASNISSGSLASARGGVPVGTSFPGSPATNDRFYRTDIGLEFFYDGTRWLSTEIFILNTAITQGALFPLTATQNDALAVAPPPLPGTDIYLLTYRARIFINSGGTALDASNKWVGNLHKYDSAVSSTTVVTTTIASGASATVRTFDTTINALLSSSTYLLLESTWTKTGTPGGLFVFESITYRVVST